MSRFQERGRQREVGSIEWFIETHLKKDKAFREPVTTKFVVIFNFNFRINGYYFNW